VEILIIQGHRSAAWTIEGSDDLEQGAFSRAGWADDSQGFARANFQGHIIQNRERLRRVGRFVAFGNAGQSQLRCRWHFLICGETSAEETEKNWNLTEWVAKRAHLAKPMECAARAQRRRRFGWLGRKINADRHT